MKAVWAEDAWIQEQQGKKEEATDVPEDVQDSNKEETVARKSKPTVGQGPQPVATVER